MGLDDNNIPAEHLRQTFANVKAKPRAAELTCRGCVTLLERLEQIRDLRRRQGKVQTDGDARNVGRVNRKRLGLSGETTGAILVATSRNTVVQWWVCGD